MAAFLAMVALGGLISYAVMAWRDQHFWVRTLAKAGVAVFSLTILLEAVSTAARLFPVEPGFLFVTGTAFAFGIALPGIVIYAMPK